MNEATSRLTGELTYEEGGLLLMMRGDVCIYVVPSLWKLLNDKVIVKEPPEP
jgi:hypothetical protein